jgi:carbonic anhydrase/acetyltransferase-like protein (isoleucine patch superfamily)
MIIEYNGHRPNIHESCFVAENATLIGQVTLKKNANIWYGAVLRGDDHYISIGENTNIQDNCVIHIDHDLPTIIGDFVTVGHGAIVHACKVGNNVLIGMGAIVLNGAEIGDNVIIAAGSLVPPGKKIPSNTLVMGSPAKVTRELTEKDISDIRDSAIYYAELANKYRK